MDGDGHHPRGKDGLQRLDTWLFFFSPPGK